MKIENNKIIFNGEISEDDDYRGLLIGDDLLCRELFSNKSDLDKDLFDLINKDSKMFVSYYISNTEINPNTIQESYLKKIVGCCEGEYNILCGTEITGVYGLDELFSIDGHDITYELKSNLGEYCHLIIEVLDNNYK